jgi:Cu/Ag efflux protein CusF
MKKFLLATAAIAVALAVALPARAEGEKKAEKPKKQQYTGEVTKVDAAGKSITVKKGEGDEKTFGVADKAKVATKDKEAAELSDLKVGDKVTVHYTEEGGKDVAHKIGPPDSAKKKEKKAEEK